MDGANPRQRPLLAGAMPALESDTISGVDLRYRSLSVARERPRRICGVAVRPTCRNKWHYAYGGVPVVIDAAGDDRRYADVGGYRRSSRGRYSRSSASASSSAPADRRAWA